MKRHNLKLPGRKHPGLENFWSEFFDDPQVTQRRRETERAFVWMLIIACVGFIVLWATS